MNKELKVMLIALSLLLITFICILACILLLQRKKDNKKDYVLKKYYYTLKTYEIALSEAVDLILAKNILHKSKEDTTNFFINKAVNKLKRVRKNV